MPDGNFTVRLIGCHKNVFEMKNLFPSKNRFAFHRKFFISAEMICVIADDSAFLVITIYRRQTAFAEKEGTLA